MPCSDEYVQSLQGSPEETPRVAIIVLITAGWPTHADVAHRVDGGPPLYKVPRASSPRFIDTHASSAVACSVRPCLVHLSRDPKPSPRSARARMKKKGGAGGGCGCLGAPMRALSRACDSACDLYVRGMSGCARGVPSGSSAGIVGRGFGGSSATSLRLRVSSDKADDLFRAAAAAAPSRRQQRRVAAEPEPERVTAEAVGGYGAGKIIGSAGGLVGSAAPAVRAPARKRAAAATMGTIAEDAPCEFGPDGGACAAPVPSMKPPRRGGFGAVKAGSDDVFAR